MKKRTQISELLSDISQQLKFSKRVLTIDEVVLYTGLAKSYLYKLTSSKMIPHYKPNGGKTVFFERRELEKWLLKNPVKSKMQLDEEAASKIFNLKMNRK